MSVIALQHSLKTDLFLDCLLPAYLASRLADEAQVDRLKVLAEVDTELLSDADEIAAMTVVGEQTAPLREAAQQADVTAGHDTQIQAVSLDNQSSFLVVGNIVTTGSDIILIAPNGIEALDPNAVIRGNRVELYAKRGGIGSASQPLRIDSDTDGTGGLAARAMEDIYIVETAGDLKLLEPEAWEDVVASVYSVLGDVHLETISGSILDAFYEQFRPGLQAELEGLYLVSPGLMRFLYPHTEFLGLTPSPFASEIPNVIGADVTLTEEVQLLRRRTARGMRCGSDEFVESMESRAGRPLDCRRTGRPRRA